MIKKWEIKRAPSRSDPKRCQLFIKCEAGDVHLLIKKLGALCGRPEKAAEPYSYSMYIIGPGPESLKKLEQVIAEIEGASVAAAGNVPSAPSPAVLSSVKNVDLSVLNGVTAKSAVSEMTPPPRPSASPLPPTSKSSVPASVPVSSPAASVKAGPYDTARLAKARWALELPLVPVYSFETLVVGPHNRFAHAAGMSVVENPGTMYNPLLFFGNPGTGKTHFLHSIGYGLSAGLGQGDVLVTDGVRLSKSVQRALGEGSITKLEALFEKVKALVVDDIHLMVLDAENRKYLSRWFNSFLSHGKQIVLTSAYPPKSLSGLENSLSFQFSQGWVVDLKPPSSQSYKAVLTQLLHGRDIVLSEEDAESIFCRTFMPLGDVDVILRDMRRLEKLLPQRENPVTHAALLDMMLGLSESPPGAVPADEEIQRALAWKPPSSGKWGRWGIFYPKDSRGMAHWALRRLEQRAAETGIKGSWEQVFMAEYNPDELYGVPFKIGDYCDSQKVNGVFILGPHPGSGLGAQEQEFRRVTAKILESMLIRCGWVGFSRITSPSAYLRAVLDLIL